MSELKIITDQAFEKKLNGYPNDVSVLMDNLRSLIIQTARDIDGLTEIKETLKWGEPSFITPIGSTLRMDWKSKTPNQYALYFQCSSRLVVTFKSIFGNQLKFEGNRAIILSIGTEIPEEILVDCIKATLMYHTVKHLPTLGI